MATSRLTLAILLACCISYVIGHSYVTSPTSRSDQRTRKSGCRGPECLGPCDVPLKNALTPAVTIARGADINVQWPRNNHAGGFIRFAWSPTSGSDVHSNFDDNVQEIHCHEIGGCGPDDASTPNGGDSGPSDGSSRACQTTIKVPAHLTDGEWTLQWAWFGGAFALGDYYSCIDYKISGGNYVAAKSEALFFGGDFTYPNQNKCKFFNTDRLHKCVNEPCNNPVFTMYQEQSGPAFGVTIAGSVKTNNAATTASKNVNNAPITSGRVTTASKAPQAPMTTAPLTTAAMPVKPATTGALPQAPMTTAGLPIITTGTKNTPTTANCAGLTNSVDNSAVSLSIQTVDTWSNKLRLVIQMDVHMDISDWMIQVIFPAEATETHIENVFNAGQLRCSANFPSRHAMIEPIASWANTIKSGEKMIVELKATNSNMNAEFIKANTQLRMFRK